MSLHDELLDTARALVRRNQNRPTQGDIRRSISTAYYALFHRLIEDGLACVGSSTAEPEALGRAFGHTDMKKVCQLVTKSPVPPQATPLIGKAIPPELQNLARAFIELQELRHEADYNRSRPFSKANASDAIGRVEAAFRDWSLVNGTPVARVFLVLLLLGDRWNRA